MHSYVGRFYNKGAHIHKLSVAYQETNFCTQVTEQIDIANHVMPAYRCYA